MTQNVTLAEIRQACHKHIQDKGAAPTRIKLHPGVMAEVLEQCSHGEWFPSLTEISESTLCGMEVEETASVSRFECH